MEKLKDGEYYWLDAPALNPINPVCIGLYLANLSAGRWYINGENFTAGPGISPIKRIPRPKLK